MSVNDIMNYVRKTPGNTNPAVIKSMVESENYGVLEKAKEYTDNAFRELGVSMEKEKVYLSGKLEYSSEVGALGTTCLVPTTKRHFTVGNSYTIKLDGGTYTGVAKILEGPGGYTYIGNVALINSDFADMNTGESYCIAEIFVEGDAQEADAGQIFVVDSNNGSNFSIEIISETVHPIKPEYLPGVCLPVVELSTIPVGEDGIPVTAEESAQLDVAFDTGLPCVAKIYSAINEKNYQRMSLIMYCVEVCFEGEYQMGFTCMVSNAICYNYDRTDNGWVARIQEM